MDEKFNQSLENCMTVRPSQWSIPPQAYRDQDIQDTEIEKIFREQWICLGRSDQVRKPGDYICRDIAGQAIILLRDKDNHLRAFANACRHRGARLLEGQGSTAGIRCPFHSWAYKLSGALAAAPKMEEAPEFCKSDFGLIAYQIRESLGFVFICLANESQDFDAAFDQFERIHSPWPFNDLISTRRQEFEVDCNWKAFIEVFNEYYHLPFVHPDSIGDLYNLPDQADTLSGQFASQFGSTEGTGALLQDQQDSFLPKMPDLKGREAAGVRYTWTFPNMTFAAGVDALWVYEAYPITPEKCHVVQTACFPQQTVNSNDFDTKVKAYYGRLDAALDEDIPALVNQQKGLNSPEAKQGRIQPLLEANVGSFTNWYATVMRD